MWQTRPSYRLAAHFRSQHPQLQSSGQHWIWPLEAVNATGTAAHPSPAPEAPTGRHRRLHVPFLETAFD